MAETLVVIFESCLKGLLSKMQKAERFDISNLVLVPDIKTEGDVLRRVGLQI